MLSWLRPKHRDDPDAIVQERWETSFSRFSKGRFPIEEDGDGYRARALTGGFELKLERENLFAWITDPLYQYRDQLIEADIAVDPHNGHSAAGFLLRQSEAGGYYYFLVSNQGYYRFDLVFNQTPRPLIPWTPAPAPVDGHLYLRLIAHDSTFVFTVNDEWVGEYSDDNLDSGRIAFAGQNYDEREAALFRLERLRIDSLPLDVETAFYRWNRGVEVPRQNRIRLAETLFASGQYSPAAVQLKKAFALETPTAGEYFLLAECCIRLDLYREAEEAVEAVLRLEPDFIDAVREKANLLYIQNRYLELRDYLRERMDLLAEESLAWNLLGHGEYGLGNWEAAAVAYRKAYEIDGEIPLYAVNTARAYERQGNSTEALDFYMKASRLYFRQEAYYDLEGLLPAIRALSAENLEVRAIEAKVMFSRGEYEAAEKEFRELIKAGYEESSIIFLQGMLKVREGRRDLGVELILKAAEMEPDYYLYWLKLADNLHAMGLDAEDEIRKAAQLNPDDPWVLNLSGLLLAEEGKLIEARRDLERAVALAPREEEIQANMAYLISREEGPEEGINYLDSLGSLMQESHTLYNQRGNLLVAAGELDKAVRCYERAIRLSDGGINDYRMNCAAACLKIDMISRAEELYQEVLEVSEDPAAMTGIGNCAWIKSEFLRAETAYREALKLQPGQQDAHCNLVELMITLRMFDQADEALQAAEEALGAETPRLMKLRRRLEEYLYDIFRCAGCSREWRAKKSSEPVPQARLHGEPPADAPAGKCEECGKIFCVECAASRIEGGRLLCECGGSLKLNDPALRRILLAKIPHP